MKNKFIIFWVNGDSYFVGSDFQKAYFSKEENPLLFNTEEQAIYRLNEESSLFPMQFVNQIFQIQKVIKFN